MNYAKLRGAIKGAGFTESDFAIKLGISRSSMSQKLGGKVDFSVEEIKKISSILAFSNDDILNVFFA